LIVHYPIRDTLHRYVYHVPNSDWKYALKIISPQTLAKLCSLRYIPPSTVSDPTNSQGTHLFTAS
jgi:hypothetical protein